MLKVVGASWLQTRISTYILVAVGLLGIGAILLGEFGSVDKDGTYSATVFWNHKGGYRIDFWGQGNDLISLPRGVARGYYKTRIQETGWSIVEIETAPSYPDAVQAYAAGLLEGSLTWQVIHHYWHNTIGTLCSDEENKERCTAIRQQLRENSVAIREKAKLLAPEDPFWHMVRLFYAQLDGMEAGWRFAVRRSRRSVDIDTEDFLWLAMASDLPREFFEKKLDSSADDLTKIPTGSKNDNGVMFVKSLDRSKEGLEPIIAIAQNTVAPYTKMLRLLKRYSFGYHLSTSRHSPLVPTRSIMMSSYPGALSSHDEYYVARSGKDNDDLLILAAIPLREKPELIIPTGSDMNDQEQIEEEQNEQFSIINIQSVMSPVRIMSANRLATDSHTWSKLLARGNPSEEKKKSSNNLQWIVVTPKDSSVWLIEQRSSIIQAFDRTENFAKNGFVFCDGESVLESSAASSLEHLQNENDFKIVISQHSPSNIEDINRFFAENITSVDAIRNLMRGTAKFKDDQNNSKERLNATSVLIEKVESRIFSVLDPLGKFVHRADLENPPKPYGVIDNKMVLVTSNGMESFEATSGPPFGHEFAGNPTAPFEWSCSFANMSHIGQPDKFEFDSVIPQWIWF